MSLARLHLADLLSRPLLGLSAFAIALGVGVVFTVVSILDGFLAEFEKTVRSFSGDVVVQSRSTGGWNDYESALQGVEGLASAKPRLDWFGLVGRRGSRALDDPRSSDLSGLLLVGLDAGDRVEVDPALYWAGGGNLPPVVLGEAVAAKLGVSPGEALEVVSFAPPSAGPTRPVRTTFRVTATHPGGRWEESVDRAFVRRADLARALGFPSGRSSFTEAVVRGKPKVDPEILKGRVENALVAAGLADPAFTGVQGWRDMGGIFLRSVEDQRGTLSMVFFFIVLVAAWQLVATLVLTVAEKRRVIGVLGALGAGPGRILAHFAGLGLLLGAVGTAGGLLMGWWMTGHLETVEKLLGGGERVFLPEIYQFETIPVAYDPASIVRLVGATLAAALFFSLVPAWRASRIPPIEALSR